MRSSAAAIAVVLALPATAAGREPATVTMAMTGDAVTGSLSFRQDLVEIRAGDSVRFANGNDLTAHEPAEEHGIWTLQVAPRASQTRTMEAGVHQILCRLHPDLMRATIRVAPTARLERTVVPRRTRRGVLVQRHIERTAVVRWADAAGAAGGERFDVARRRRGGAWQDWRTDTRTRTGRFRVAAGDGWEVRTRLRGGDQTTDWSPVVPVVE